MDSSGYEAMRMTTAHHYGQQPSESFAGGPVPNKGISSPNRKESGFLGKNQRGRRANGNSFVLDLHKEGRSSPKNLHPHALVLFYDEAAKRTAVRAFYLPILAISRSERIGHLVDSMRQQVYKEKRPSLKWEQTVRGKIWSLYADTRWSEIGIEKREGRYIVHAFEVSFFDATSFASAMQMAEGIWHVIEHFTEQLSEKLLRIMGIKRL